jgi:two-component system, chemotaxis family, protein-glutamate methylesterase/glutaminase
VSGDGAVRLRRKPADPEGRRRIAKGSPGAPSAAVASWRWLALGASTGGPAALHDLLAELPKPPPLRVVIVQHIARGFEIDLAEWLADSLGLDVRVAQDGESPRSGAVRLAPAGAHLRVSAGDRLEIDTKTPARRGRRPSVDELFLSLAAAAPHDTAAVLLSGMGTDGAEGLSALRRAGAFCLAQDEASSVVFGMPGAALELGAAELALPPGALGRELARRLGGQA